MWWVRFLGAGVAVLAVHVILPAGTTRAILYAAVMAAAVAAIASAANRPRLVFGVESVLEAAVGAVGIALVAWVFVIDFPGGDSVAPAVIHTVVDAFVVAVALTFVLAARPAGAHNPGMRAVALVALLGVAAVADFATVLQDRPFGSAVITSAILAACIGLGAVALYPATSSVQSTDRPKPPSGFGPAQLFGFGLAICVTPAVMGIQLVRDIPATQWGWAAVFSLVLLVVLVSARLTYCMNEMQHRATGLTRSARTDSVTGLLARGPLEESIGAMLAIEGEATVAALVVDVDRFAQINETFGYGIGDSVLREIGNRLDASVSAGDIVGRLGGDQFAVVVRSPNDRNSVISLARRLQYAVSRTMFVHDIDVALEATVGVAMSCPDSNTAETLLQHAHVALTAAKAEHEHVALYRLAMDKDRHDQLRLLGELETALRERQLRVYYQPCLHLESGRVTGMEALLRWQHPRDGLIAPATFLPDAERTGLLPAITAYVVDEALRQCAELRTAGRDMSVSVNLSVRNLLDPGLVETVVSALGRHDMPASAIEFEVTETSAMTDPRRSVEALSALRRLGASIAIDDYGTGYSSLAYVRTLPVQRLKIDRSFVMSMNAQLTSSSIVQSTTELALSLGMSLVAEGVEDEATLDALRALGCESAQGYFIGRPSPGAEVENLISSIEARYGGSDSREARSGEKRQGLLAGTSSTTSNSSSDAPEETGLAR